MDWFAYRHDSVLAHLLNTINKHKGEEVETFADLNGHRVNNGTLPLDLCETEQKPDFVVVMRNPSVKKVLLIELAVPWDSQSSFKAAFERKTSRYAQLALDQGTTNCGAFSQHDFIQNYFL